MSVVVPVYNSERSLPILTERLYEVFRKENQPFEIIFVDDDSSDNSWEVITALARDYENIRGIKLLRNFGQHNALLCGIRAVRYDVIVTMDDDLQNPPDEVPRLLAALQEGVDVVYGTPIEGAHGVLRQLASEATKIALSSAMGAETARKVSAFRVFRRSITGAFSGYRSPWVSLDVLLTWGTRRFASIPVRNDPRTIGKSNYTVGRLIAHALNMITGFSVLPLQFASVVGFFFTLFGIGVLCFVVGRYLIQGVAVPGFAFLASIIAIFGGAQLFALGVIGEYLARIHFRSMDRPPYAVREFAGTPPDAFANEDALVTHGVLVERGAGER